MVLYNVDRPSKISQESVRRDDSMVCSYDVDNPGKTSQESVRNDGSMVYLYNPFLVDKLGAVMIRPLTVIAIVTAEGGSVWRSLDLCNPRVWSWLFGYLRDWNLIWR